jgi:uncharacterized protein (DUF486 family)
VPANRLGYGQFTAAQLKIVQEVITVVVFIGFARLYLGERVGTRRRPLSSRTCVEADPRP